MSNIQILNNSAQKLHNLTLFQESGQNYLLSFIFNSLVHLGGIKSLRKKYKHIPHFFNNDLK